MNDNQSYINKYPPTRYMGSKNKLLDEIWQVTKHLNFQTVLDLFSGSGAVGYMYKCHGKAVTSNDYMTMSATFAKAMIENNLITLPLAEAKSFFKEKHKNDHFVENTFQGIYFSDGVNQLIDVLRSNILPMEDPYKKAIAMTALIRTCMKKRARGIFTYTGNRYDDGRKDLHKPFEELFIEQVEAVNAAIFDNGQNNKALCGDALNVEVPHQDLVYIDPPYFTPKSDNEYVRRYHFVEGLARNWEGVEIQENTKTKKFKSYTTPFSTYEGAKTALEYLFDKYCSSILVASYSSNSLPDKEEMLSLLRKNKPNVEVIPVSHRYSFGTTKSVKRNNVEEYIFVGY